MIKNLIDSLKDYFIDDLKKHPEVIKETSEPKEPMQIQIAKKYHGLHEVNDNIKLKALLGFDPSKTAWCAGFVNAIERMCKRQGTGKLTARSYLKYGVHSNNPTLGDIVVFKRGKLPWQGHVAYYIQRDGDQLLVLGGNQSNKVCYKYYPASAILDIRTPR